MIFEDFSELPVFHYGLIMADPPWLFENWSEKGTEKNASSKYECMTIGQIKRLPVGHVAAKDSVLWLWATNPMLPQALDVMKAWGFTFKTAGHWVKKTTNDGLAFGPGYILRSAGEPFLIGVNGSPQFQARNIRSVIEGPKRQHSRKPDEAYAAAMNLAKGPYLDLFSREARDGWDQFGNEVHKFDEAA